MNTTLQTGAAIAFMTGFFFFIISLSFIWYILQIIANWKIFKKAGEPGWKCLIPIYNNYISFKIVGMKNWFWALLGLTICGCILSSFDGGSPMLMSEAELQVYNWAAHPLAAATSLIVCIAAIYIAVVCCYRTAKVFGHGIGYTFGLIFLQPIFLLILGFGKSKYDKKLYK